MSYKGVETDPTTLTLSSSKPYEFTNGSPSPINSASGILEPTSATKVYGEPLDTHSGFNKPSSKILETGTDRTPPPHPTNAIEGTRQPVGSALEPPTETLPNVIGTSAPPNTLRRRAPSISEAGPGTPVSVTPDAGSVEGWAIAYPSLNLFDYFRAELGASEFDLEHEVKRERLANFLKVPREFEKLMFFGFCVCLNSILYNFTILPTRLLAAISALVTGPFSGKGLGANQLSDLVRGTLISTSCCALCCLDLSRLYHAVRGQSVVKLYVIFNMLEIFDRLAASLGQDLLNALFADLAVGGPQRVRVGYQFLAAALYIPLHTAGLLYQMMALNVSVNSYNDALLSLLMSSQFVEIKGSVFKKFERETLFQLTCSDITERFQLTIFLMAITLRNVSPILGGGRGEGFARAVLPTSFRRLLPSSVAAGVDLLLSPAVLVLMCEVLVDWAKHAFITKFNHIRPSVYGRYLDLLCKDIVSLPSRAEPKALVDQSPAVARRMGLSVLPLTCLIIRVALQLFGIKINQLPGALHSATRSLRQLWAMVRAPGLVNERLSSQVPLSANSLVWVVSALLVFISLTVIKLLLGHHLLRYAASRHPDMGAREAADATNAKEDTQLNFKELNRIRSQLASSEGEDLYRPRNLDLRTIDRFALFKSRVP
ncbi:hypothetical protein L0F63_006859 [Massospora cicadina]|nr:hypothetical protein L0F63_006859 [Massospora cicadina]